jgi:hypothetical protein
VQDRKALLETVPGNDYQVSFASVVGLY